MTRRAFGPKTTYESRDIERELVRMLWTFQFATTDQLTRLLWNASTPTLRRRTTMALQRLLDLFMVAREARRPLPGYRSQLNGRASAGYYYALTEAGRAAFAEWVNRPPGPEQIRHPLLLTLSFGRHVAPARLATSINPSTRR